jgi:hypothetical protein
MATHRERQPIPLFAELHAGLDRLEAQHGPMPEIATLREQIRQADPNRTVYVAINATDAVVGAAQLGTIVKLLGDRMPDETIALLGRIAAALEGAK